MTSWVKALQKYMSEGENGRKVEISEFKELTDQDKMDFHQMLVDEGIDVEPITPKAAA